MGETSAKQMRGAEMDDVIFGGTASRPQRNMAEVLLSLDNQQRTAPAIFNNDAELEVSRKIERDKGSTYRVNGREVRARDIQLLFADSSTGARSTALVSQGRIGAVINAKPQQRRSLLEEAAGITGLHSRRHEAELRLNGAETNLERLDDILVTLDTQLLNLKKQSRQANRYTNLSDHIQKAEATLFHIRWKEAEKGLEAAKEELRKTETKVGELTALSSKAATEQLKHADNLPPLREAEAKAAAELHRLTVARDTLATEEKHIRDALINLRQRLEQITLDQGRAKAFAVDITSAIKTLKLEETEIESARKTELEERNAAGKKLSEADSLVNSADADLNNATTFVADIEAKREILMQRIRDAEKRLEQMTSRSSEIEHQQEELTKNQPDSSAIENATQLFKSCAEAVKVGQTALSDAEDFRSAAEEKHRSAAAGLANVKADQTRLKAEEQAIAKILDIAEDDLWPPLVDKVSVKPGYEMALGVALGEDLNVPSNEAALIHWRTLEPISNSLALPIGVKPISDFVSAPPALSRRLEQIGVVATDQQGKDLVHSLKQGQRLVSREGGLWRWDGFTVSSQAATPSAVRLEQRTRLTEIGKLLLVAGDTVNEAKLNCDAALQAEHSARQAEYSARQALKDSDLAFNAAREALTNNKEKSAIHNSRMKTVSDTLNTVAADRDEIRDSLVYLQGQLTELPDPVEKRESVVILRTKLAEYRASQADCRSRYDQFERLAKERGDRLRAIITDLQTWERRNTEASQQIEDLVKREETLSFELSVLEAKPETLESRRKELLNSIMISETRRDEAADALAQEEVALREADQILREAETTLSNAREHRVRGEGLVDQAKQACLSIAERIADRLSSSPENMLSISGLDPADTLPDLEAIERKVDRLIRERETMGPVNLRAQQEGDELTAQINTLNGERADLLTAIEKLRQGISELNREGRARLLASFKEVDKHFQSLFIRLFGGGQAHLSLTESEDPLKAGLEIMASPPGKKLQVLSLLSGGEQALTALALLFGVFLTNPAPICVLDEVDAPLDDANVDRFCKMLEEMAQEKKTRFLIITHHRMTMARMDRLFGVTMQERGVSQLVSVDLEAAERIRDIA